MTIEATVRARGGDSLRRRNLSSLLTLVHRSGGVSRSELTSLTRLNRSTIAALVGELVELQLVHEVEPDSRNRVGRPSPVVQPGDLPVALTVHPEIDALTVTLVGLGGRVLARVRHDTDHVLGASEAVAVTARSILALGDNLRGHRVVRVGAAVPALVRARDGLIRLAPHLEWVDEPFAAMLEEATGYPVVAGNDGSLGALAESTFGAGRSVDDLVYLIGGPSGIGGGILSHGGPLTGLDGYAGEIGHVFVNSNGVRCHCGAFGCLETEVQRARLLSLVGLTDAAADDLEDALIASEAPEVAAEVRRQQEFLAIALRNATNMFNPQRIVLGGFLGSLYAADPLYLDSLLADQALAAPRQTVRVVRAELGRNFLAIGAAELAFAELLSDPAGFAASASLAAGE